MSMRITKSKQRIVATIGIMAALTMALSACAGNAEGGGDSGGSSEEVHIGVVASLSGHTATTLGVPFSNGFELAMEHAEETGVLQDAGVDLNILKEDAQSETAAAVAAFNSVSREGAQIVVQDSNSPLGQAIAPLANDTEVVLLSGAGSPLENPEGYAFRFTDLETTSEAAGEHLNEQGYERVGAIVGTDTSSFDIMANSVAKGLGEDFVIREDISTADTNFATVLENLHAKDIDALVLEVFPEQVGNILVQMEQHGGFEGVQVIGNLATSEETFAIAGDAADDLIFPQAWAPGGEDSVEFETDYEARFSTSPTSYAGLGYQVGWVTVAAIIEAKKEDGEVTSQDIRDLVPNVSTSDLVQQYGIVDLTLTAEGDSITNGSLAEFDSNGKVARLDK